MEDNKNSLANRLRGAFEDVGFNFFLFALFTLLLIWPYLTFAESASFEVTPIYFFVIWLLLIVILLLSQIFHRDSKEND